MYEVLADDHNIVRVTFYMEGSSVGERRDFDLLPDSIQQTIVDKLYSEHEQN
jgi:hypothetical protein